MNKILSIIFAATLLLSVATTASATGTSNCQVIYGGGEVCQEQVKFTINKMVQKPGKGGGDFVENLTVSDPRYAPSQNINFKIVIENTGDRDIKNLNVVDTFPQYLTFAGGVGNSNIGASQITFVIGELKKGAKAEYLISAKTADSANLPSNQAVTCVTNNIKATSAEGATAEDNSQVCIEKNVLGITPAPQIMEKPTVKSVPATGPEMGLLAALVPAALAGFYIKKRAN